MMKRPITRRVSAVLASGAIVCVTAAHAGAQIPSIRLNCQPRDIPGYSNQYLQPIILAVDFNRRVVELISLSGSVQKSTPRGLYPTQNGGDLIGPLRVDISEQAIDWGAPGGIGYLAEFDGTVNRTTGNAEVRWYDARHPAMISNFSGTCGLVAATKIL